MIEVGSYWQYIFADRVVKIVEISQCMVVVEWKKLSKPGYYTTFNVEFDINYFLTQFEQLTPLEVELI